MSRKKKSPSILGEDPVLVPVAVTSTNASLTEDLGVPASAADLEAARLALEPDDPAERSATREQAVALSGRTAEQIVADDVLERDRAEQAFVRRIEASDAAAIAGAPPGTKAAASEASKLGKKRLPVVAPGSSAGSTTFCAAKVEGPGGHLWIDGNQKITAGNGTYAEPRPNAFSLVQVQDCPGSTAVCRSSCYVHGLEREARATHDLYRHNSDLMRKIAAGGHGGREWVQVLASWISEHAPGGFRWHVSGDLFSLRYAELVSAVVGLSPDVEHWIYTRSFSFVWPLLARRNLAINLSADRANIKAARDWMRSFRAQDPGAALRLAYLCDDGAVPDLPEGSVIFPDYKLRGRDLAKPLEGEWWLSLTPDQRKMTCPVDYLGKSESIRCGVCRKCFT